MLHSMTIWLIYEHQLDASTFVTGSNVNLGSTWGHPGRVRCLWQLQILVLSFFFFILQIDLVSMEKDPEPDGEWCHFGHYMCHFSKYHILFPMKHKTAEEVVQNLQERVFPYIGVPLILQSDNGGEFSRIFEEVLRVWPTPLTLINGSASKVCSFFFKFDFAILCTLKLFRSNFSFSSNVMKLKFATYFTLMMTNKAQCRCGGRLSFCTPSTLHYDWEFLREK